MQVSIRTEVGTCGTTKNLPHSEELQIVVGSIYQSSKTVMECPLKERTQVQHWVMSKRNQKTLVIIQVQKWW